MRIRNILVLSAITACISQPALCKDSSSSSGSSKDQASSSGSTASEIRLSKLMEANVSSKSGENLGQVQDFAINPKTGKIDFAIVGTGGASGAGQTYIPVPWKAIQVSSEKQFTLNVDKQKLQSAPTTGKDLSEFQQPDYTVTIYRFFEVPEDVGAAETPGGSEQGGASSSGSSRSGSSSSSGSSTNSPSGQ